MGSKNRKKLEKIGTGHPGFPSKFWAPDYSFNGPFNAQYYTKMMRTIRRINSAGNTEISRTQKICDYCLSILLSLCVQALELCESAQQKKSYNTRHELWCFTYQFNHRLKIGILNKHITLDCPYLKFTDQKVETHFKSLKGANGLKCHYYLLNSPR